MSAKRVVYVVEPRRGVRWAAQRRAVSAPAITEARRLARQHPLSQVVIKNGNGRIEREYTYGKDPRRFRG